MKQQINEIKRMQQLAGIITENESNNDLLGKKVELIMISPIDKKSFPSLAKIIKVEDNSIRIKAEEFGSERDVRIGTEGINQLVNNGEWNAPNGKDDGGIVKIKVIQ